MATYSIFGSGAFSSAQFTNTRGSGGEIDSTEFYVTTPCWLTQVRFYRLNTNITGTVTGAVYQVSTSTTGTLVSGTSGNFTLSGTGWQALTLATPVRLTQNQRYRTCIQWGTNRIASTNTSYWAAGGPGVNGLTNGPLVAPSNADATGGYTSLAILSASMAFPNIAVTYAYSCDVTVTDVDPTGHLQSDFNIYL